MTTNLATPQFEDILKLNSFTEVWAIELADIDDCLSGNNPDSFKSLMGGIGKKVQAKTGLNENDQHATLAGVLGGLGVLGSVAGLALAAGSVGLGIDGVNDFKTINKADDTERLLVFKKRSLASANWDTVTSLIEHVQSWLLPRLNSRIVDLTAVLQASQGHQVVTERLSLYEKGVAEIKDALEALKRRERTLHTEWDKKFKGYSERAAETRKIYEEARRGVELSVKALLFDRTAGAAKLDEIESNYARLRCSCSTMFSGCENLASEDSPYCLEHTCFESECTEMVADKSRYCKKHGNQLADVSAHFPKHLQAAGMKSEDFAKPKETFNSSPKDKQSVNDEQETASTPTATTAMGKKRAWNRTVVWIFAVVFTIWSLEI
jgi:hypothetical protein